MPIIINTEAPVQVQESALVIPEWFQEVEGFYRSDADTLYLYLKMLREAQAE